MSKFIEKIKAIVEKVKAVCEKFFATPVGNFVKKVLAMMGVLLLVGGIICIVVAAAIMKMGFVPCVAIVIVCVSACDELVKWIKVIIND